MTARNVHEKKDSDYPSRQKVNTTCPRCGLTVERLKRHADLLCRSCAAKDKLKGALRGCAECGDEFYAKAGEVKRGGGKYCSRACWRLNARLTDEQYRENAERQRKTRQGKSNPRFKHGKRVGIHLQGWNVAAKGEDECRNCGQLAIHLHHIVPRSLAPAGRPDVEGNGLPLCRECHQGWHHMNVWIYRDRLRSNEIETAEKLMSSWWVEKRYPHRPETELLYPSENPKVAA